jgi:hypothetical protein
MTPRHQFAMIRAHQSRLAPAVKAAFFLLLVAFPLMPVVFIDHPPPSVARRALTEADAIDIWLARWMRVRRRDLLERYACDPRRLYEIWEGVRFPASRAKALKVLADKFPSVMSSIDLGCHRRVPSRSTHPDQLSLFD